MKNQVLVLSNSSDGLYGFRKELLAELSQQSTLCASVPDNGRFEELRALGCQVVETPIDRRGLNPFSDLKLLMRYIRLIRSFKPTRVITYTIKPNIYGGFACQLFHVPYAANITGLGTTFQKDGILRKLVIWLYRFALRKADVVFFENCGNMETILDLRILAAEKCCLLNGAGVNLEHYSLMPYPQEAEPVRFLFIGRIMREKGVQELFEAMERLIRECYPCQLDLVGYFEEDFKTLIDQNVKEGWLHYHGYQNDVRPFIRNSHCFVLPSWHEGMANTNLECAAMGRPLITSRIHGCMEAVIEGESGFLCEPQNTDSLYEAMVRFCEMPQNKREAMGRAGRRHMEEVFDKGKVVAETLERII